MKWIDDVKKQIAKDLLKATQVVLKRAKVSTSSDLYRELEWEFKKDVWTLVAYDYYKYVSTGRRSGSMPPVKDLIPWIKKNGISARGMTVNQLAFAIATSIKRNGIKGKKYEDKVVDVSTDILSEELSEELSEKITEDIANAINNT